MNKTSRFLRRPISVCSLVIFTFLSPLLAQTPPPPPPPTPPIEEIFRVIEKYPRFPGCDERLNEVEMQECVEGKFDQYIYANLKYPQLAIENKIEGTVIIQFTMEKDGSIITPVILRDIGAGCGAEALRLVKALEKHLKKEWTPGKSRSKVVRALYNLPIKFELDSTKHK